LDWKRMFHVDKLSSAHIYLRMNEGDTWDAIPQELVVDCAQLTKANSIEGNKKDNVTVIYTPWSNLRKDGSMVVGQVGFKDSKKVKRILVEKRENPIVNRLNKTKVERFPDLQQEKEARLKQLRERDRAAQQERVRYETKAPPLALSILSSIGKRKAQVLLIIEKRRSSGCQGTSRKSMATRPCIRRSL